MAIVWGTKINKMQLGIDVSVTAATIAPGYVPPDPSGNNASTPKPRKNTYYFTIKVYARSDADVNYWFTDVLGWVKEGGASLGGWDTKNVSFQSATGDTGAKLLHTWTTSENPLANRARTLTFRAELNLASATVIAKVATTYTIPKNPFSVPRVPNSPLAARITDTQINMSWVRNADSPGPDRTTYAPWTGVRIDRWSRSTNSWVKLVDVTGNTETYQDKTVKANDRYQYRYRSYNADGYSKWVFSALIATTPLSPTALTAERFLTTIQLKWTDRAPYVTGYEIYDNGVKIADIGAVASFTHASPSAGSPHVYTMKTKADSLLSALSPASNSVSVPSPPNAPTNLAAEPRIVGKIADPPVKLVWKHNPVDSSAQTQWEVEITNALGGKTTFNSSTRGGADNQFASFNIAEFDPAYTLGGCSFRVRTRGTHATFSAWSASYSFFLYDEPTADILTPSPGMVVDTNDLLIQWTYDHPTSPQVGFIVILEQEGVVVYNETIPSFESEYTVPYPLIDRQSYTLKFQVMAANGLASIAEVIDFYVDYAEPMAPQVVSFADPDGGFNSLDISNGQAVGYADTILNRVYRNVNRNSPWYAFDEQVTQPDSVINYLSIPSFRQVGGLVEVGRNLAKSPNPIGPMVEISEPRAWYLAEVNGWAATTDTGLINNIHTQIVQIEALGTGGWSYRLNDSTTKIPVNPANWVTLPISFNLGYTGTSPLKLVITWYNAANVPIREETPLTGLSRDRYNLTRVSTDQYIPADAVSVTVSIESTTGNKVNDLIFASRLMVGGFDGEYYDGYGHPDLAIGTSWAGTPENSESIAHGFQVLGVTGHNCFTILSYDSRGNERLRLIPTNGSNDSYAEIAVPDVEADALPMLKSKGTVLGTIEVEAPLEGTLHANALQVRMLTAASETSPQAPNGVGLTELRNVFENIVSPYRIRFYHGGAKGSGNVYWSKAGLFIGDFKGSWADGSLGPFTNTDGMLGTPDWIGEPDLSPTLINYTFPNFIASEWELMGEYEPNAEVIDYKAVTNGKTMYMVEAISDIPSLSRTLVPVFAHSPSVWINHGDTFEEVMNLFYSLEVAETLGHPDANRQFFDGRPLPVLFNGVSVERGVTVTGKIYPREGRGATYDELFELMNRPGPHLYRDMDGRRFYGNIEEFASTRVSKFLYSLSFRITEVEYEEF